MLNNNINRHGDEQQKPKNVNFPHTRKKKEKKKKRVKEKLEKERKDGNQIMSVYRRHCAASEERTRYTPADFLAAGRNNAGGT